MTKQSNLERIAQSGIVAVIRAPSSVSLVDVAESLLAGGVEAMEITFTVPRAPDALEEITARLGDKVLLGAGTVLDAETARIAILSGAQFIVAPTLDFGVIRLCRRYDKLVMPGAFTPTEVLSAWEAGADVVKVFPSDVTGAAYLKALAGPLPQIRLMPTGGVTLETAPNFLRAGAFAVGVGSALVDPKAIAAGRLAHLESLARQFVEVVRSARGS